MYKGRHVLEWSWDSGGTLHGQVHTCIATSLSFVFNRTVLGRSVFLMSVAIFFL